MLAASGIAGKRKKKKEVGAIFCGVASIFLVFYLFSSLLWLPTDCTCLVLFHSLA